MLEEFQQGRNKLAYRVYIGIILVTTLIIAPIQQIQHALEYNKQFKAFTQTLTTNPTPTQQNSQIQLSKLYPLLARNPFIGTWQSSIKRSQYLKQQQGKIQLRSSYNQSEDVNNYDLRVIIYDGWYRDSGYYQIVINSAAVKVKQRYQGGKLLYQTVTPLICYYRQGYGFKLGADRSLYVNKLKIKLSAGYANSQIQSQAGVGISSTTLSTTVSPTATSSSTTSPSTPAISSIKLQFLISSEYSINVIGRDILQYPQTFHDLLLALILILQLSIQGYGLYYIAQNILIHKQNIMKYSKTGFLFAVGLDVSQAVGLTFIGIINKKKIAVFGLPILALWLMIILIELRILAALFHEQYNQSSLKFSFRIYVIFSIICLSTYILNFHPIYFLTISLLPILPQIYNNYSVGHSLKTNMKHFFSYMLPRYTCIIYIRMYKFNQFEFEPNYWLCGICALLIVGQIVLIVIQVKFGVRSIVPKFLYPQELKYFISQIQTQDDTCSICLVSLKEKAIVESNQHIQMSQDKPVVNVQQENDIQNNIVLTPCRHKFHIQCLARSMKNKSQCPNCRTKLPPLQQYE